MPSYTYIQKQQQLDLALVQLKSAPTLAVDTESSGYYTYFSELCLIQLSAGESHYIVDVLGNINLDGLGALFADEGIQKIFHGAASDVGELKNAYGWEVKNVFDTLFACRMLAHKSCSLASLVKEYRGVELKKKEQKSNWKKRPLTRSQLDYANLDTVYLEDLRDKMIAEIEDEDLLEELRLECEDVLGRLKVQDRIYDENSWTRINGALFLSPRERGRLKALHAVREERARKDNIAPFRIISNDGLLRMASSEPRSIEDLKGLRAANPLFIKKDGKRILTTLAQAEPIADAELPVREEVNEEARALLKELKKWRHDVAEYRGLDESLILNNRVLQAVAENRPKNREALEKLELISPWKLNAYGDRILQVVKNEYRGESDPALKRVQASRRSRTATP